MSLQRNDYVHYLIVFGKVFVLTVLQAFPWHTE